MDITITTGRSVVPGPLRSVTEEKVSRLERYIEGLGIEVIEVRFSEERNPRITEREVCDLALRDRHGRVVRTRARAGEIPSAVDRTVAKMTHRIEKLKGRLAGRQGRRHGGLAGRSPGGPPRRAATRGTSRAGALPPGS